jgi:hypothetical protein
MLRILDVAAYLHVTYRWTPTGKLPTPDQVVGNGPLWKPGAISS